MTPGRWARITELAGQALEMPAGERAAFLASIGDEPLRCAVERLLEQEAKSSLRMAPGAWGPAPADMLAHYRIEAQLGEGGMGAVYRAYDTRLRRQVAIKVLLPEYFADPDRKQRLLREARAASALNHPNIVTVHDAGSEDGLDYIVMEYVEGRSLAQAIPSDGLPAERALEYALEMAGALARAHSAGVVHRDLKPGNVMITAEGHVKLLDFGLARRVQVSGAESSTLTVKGEITGTPAYMSPEQADGKPGDARSDIFAFGATLYEMLSGKRAFSGDSTLAILGAVIGKEPPALVGLPSKVYSVVKRCLRKEPELRFQSMEELKLALEAVRRSQGWLWKERRMYAAGAACLLLLLALAAVWKAGWFWHGFPARMEARGSKAIAVLPFSNMTGDPVQEYFTDGITDELIARLARIKALTVISPESARRYKGTKKSMAEIGRELKVHAVVEGSVQLSGTWMRLTARLVETATDRQLWAKDYDRGVHVKEAHVLRDDLVRAIAADLGVTLTPAEQGVLRSARAVVPEAYEAYLKGKSLHHPYTKEAMALFELAVERDPMFAPAWAGLAESHAYMNLAPRATMGTAKALAIKALDIDPECVEAHMILGIVNEAYDYDLVSAGREFRRALELSPNHARTLLYYSSFLGMIGRHQEAIDTGKRALDLDPLNEEYRGAAGQRYHFARQYDQAIELFKLGLLSNPTGHAGRVYHWGLGRAYLAKGNIAEAIHEIEMAGPGREFEASLGNAYGRAGRKGEALKILKSFDRFPTSDRMLPFSRAVVYAGLGDKDRTFLWLERAYEERHYSLPLLQVEPYWDNVRADPRFQSIVRRIKWP